MAIVHFADLTTNSRLEAYYRGIEEDSAFNGFYDSLAITRDPLITGYAMIKWIDLPVWVEYKPGKIQMPIKALMEKNFRSFSGINDIELNTMSIQEGFSQSEVQFAASSQRFQGFSINTREYQGSPISNSIGLWVTSIRDPVTNVATYPSDIEKGMLYGKGDPKLIKDGEKHIAYTAKNHTGALLYVSLRPDADMVSINPSVIEKAILWTMVMPTKYPQQHYNFTSGSNDGVEIDLSFTGIPIMNDKVKQFAVGQFRTAAPYHFVHSSNQDPSGVVTGGNQSVYTGASNGTLSSRLIPRAENVQSINPESQIPHSSSVDNG